MKNFMLCLSTTLAILFLASPSHSEDGHQIRYGALSGPVSMTLSHDIEVVREQPHEPVTANRSFAFDLTLASGKESSVVTIDKARATYFVHGQKARLGTRHLTGTTFSVASRDRGRRLEPDADGPIVELGPPVSPGISVADTLGTAMPALPASTVAEGSTWTTERRIRSLEGWKWTTGQLVSRHRVEAVEQEDGHTIVTVKTLAEATLDPVEGTDDKKPAGTLKQNLNWRFDATSGRVLSLSMEQKSDLMTIVPQGEIHVLQTTLLELAPRS